jgi:acetylornithine deacetylase/succinyl-diaminopimelate desuccinylase-like protein
VIGRLIGCIAFSCLFALSSASPASALWPFGRGGPDVPKVGEDLPGAAAELLSLAIQIDTTNPPGDEAPLARLFVDVAKREGLEAQLIETPSAGSDVGRAAAWARLPGRGTRRPIVLLSHLDVVPADGDGWVVDPFSGLVTAGYVVGRGALDSKGVSVVHLLAMAELARRNTRLDRDVLFLATPDEESGGHSGAGWLVRRRPDLLRGAEFLLTEGGGILAGDGGDPNVWGVGVAEKGPCWARLVSRGTPGHGSTAGPAAAVPRLVAALERVRAMPLPVRVVPEVATMFAWLAPIAAPEDRAGYADLAAALREDPAFRHRFLADGARNALVRNTVNITVLTAGSHTNVAPEEARADLDVRLLPGESCNAFLDRLRVVIDDPAVQVQSLLAFEPLASPARTELFDAIERVAAEVDPGALVVPRVIAGFTDAHWFRELGLVAYGFVPRWLPPSETVGIHGSNERIAVDNLERGVRTMVRILEVLGHAADADDAED